MICQKRAPYAVGLFLLGMGGLKFMGNKITEVRAKRLRSGVELQGMARTDRGTKYILDSIVVPFVPGEKYTTIGALEEGMKKLIGGD
jgi:hypothetical protein